MIRAGIKNMFLITGAIMGAGYASGREIWQFFGAGSGLAILLFTVFFIVCTTTILNISYELQSTNYVPVLHRLTGKKLALVYDYLIFIYLFSVTVVMIAGSGATFESFGIPFWWGIIFIIAGLLIIFSKGISELLNINQLLMPLLIIALVVILLVFMKDGDISFHRNWEKQDNWTAAFPFTALNILPLIAVLGAIGNRIKSKGEIYIASVSSGLILGIITFIYNTNLMELAEQVELPAIPLYLIINNYGQTVIVVMMLMLWLAIYTTAAATLLGMVTRVNKKLNLSLLKAAAIMLTIMLPFSLISFTQLVAFIYPLYGILNLYILVKLLLYPVWKNNR
ncbi:YkvI family membrane protein [Oceanobacillus alkalisoli]|uniref:YkvI family membrane protein n=1 Tax=Oceanobacillus alkalisoli TaxID=2925113 RepID=UPI001EF0EA0A|nr:hypothetical protein [Oceanobacillus alkalisoli]MCF3943997.1 hypothetical protein [Oceanobacillus alkalisoli]MCG5103269.1 hypothetical protein [Oceanobacillus alkalisoli]